MPKQSSALFLDRDGVINVDHGYVCRPDQFEFVPGIFELARFWADELGWPIIVVTNQSGIGRGYFDERTYADLTQWMCGRFADEGAAIARVYHCPYHPVDGIGEFRRDHPWRKPNPGMILQAASDLALDLARSAIVGDKMSDMGRCSRRNCRADSRGIGGRPGERAYPVLRTCCRSCAGACSPSLPLCVAWTRSALGTSLGQGPGDYA